jgi:hypothetical protein
MDIIARIVDGGSNMIGRHVRKESLVQEFKSVADGNACGRGIGTHLHIAIDDPAFESTARVAAMEIGVVVEGKVVVWESIPYIHGHPRHPNPKSIVCIGQTYQSIFPSPII